MVYLGRARPPLTRLASTGEGRSNYGRIVAHLFADWGPPRTPLVRALRCGERRRDHSCERLFPPFARSFGAGAGATVAEGNRILAVVIEGRRRTSTSGQSRERKRVKTDRSHCVFLALCPLRDSLSEEDGTMRCRVRPAHRRRRAARGHAEGGRASRGSAVGRSVELDGINRGRRRNQRARGAVWQAGKQAGRKEQARKEGRPTDRPTDRDRPLNLCTRSELAADLGVPLVSVPCPPACPPVRVRARSFLRHVRAT